MPRRGFGPKLCRSHNHGALNYSTTLLTLINSYVSIISDCKGFRFDGLTLKNPNFGRLKLGLGLDSNIFARQSELTQFATPKNSNLIQTVTKSSPSNSAPIIHAKFEPSNLSRGFDLKCSVVSGLYDFKCLLPCLSSILLWL